MKFVVMLARNIRLPRGRLALYAAWAAVLTVSYFGVLAIHAEAFAPLIWGLIGVSGIGAVVYGIYQNNIAYRLPWFLFAGAMLLFVTGDCYFKTEHFMLNHVDPFPSLADVLYLLTYPLFGAGLYMLIRRQSKQRGSVLDALTITVSLALFLWVYLVAPTIATNASTLSRTVSIAYPLGDVIVLAFLARLLTVNVRTRAMQFLALGAAGLICSDVIYALGQFYGTWHEGNPVDIGWIIFYTAWGMAALHPSAGRSAQMRQEPIAPVHASRLFVVAPAALVAPAILFVKAQQGKGQQVAAATAVFAAVLFTLVILRLFTFARTLSRREAALDLKQEKDELLAVTSHQLRTPLTVTQLYADAVGTLTDMAQIKKYADIISGANKRMITIVNQIVYTAEIDGGGVYFKNELVRLDSVVEQSLKDVSAVLQERQAHVDNTIPAAIPMVRGDSSALATVFAAVLTNAAQYSVVSPVIGVTASIHDDHVAVIIRDNGQGIPVDERDKIFTKLFRGSNARTLAPDGSGLSLYLARAVLMRMSGTIEIASPESGGTVVTISLPVAYA